MRVLILGGTAFMGPYIIRHLQAQGHEVAVFHRGKSNNNLPERVSHILGDRRDLPNFLDRFKEYKPHALIDMLCLTAADAEATAIVATQCSPRLLVASSIDVYRAYGVLLRLEEGLEPTPLTETSPLRSGRYPYRGFPGGDDPTSSMYAYDKISVEERVLNDPAIQATVLRLPMVYGPYDSQHRMHGYLQRMVDQRPAIFIGQSHAVWQTARGYVENMAAAIAVAATDDRAIGQVFNAAEEPPVDEQTWIQRIADTVGWDGKLIIIPDDELPEALRELGNTAQHLSASSAKLRTLLGFQDPVDLATCLRRTVAWERQNPPPNSEPIDYSIEDAVLAKGH